MRVAARQARHAHQHDEPDQQRAPVHTVAAHQRAAGEEVREVRGGELEQLNQNLESEVERQVERIQRGQLLGRFLPREISERVLDGGGDSGLEHARREVTVLCAVPFGFLEELHTLEADRVVPLVNNRIAISSASILASTGPRASPHARAEATTTPARSCLTR